MKLSKSTLFLFFIATIFIQQSCKKDSDSDPKPIESDLVINEFMASNDSTVTDQDGEYDDWIELYNTGSGTIDISGYSISDDADELNQWSFPTGTVIEAGSYLIVWADKDEEQVGLHANCKLSAGGETIYLTDANGEIVDEVIYDEQTTDVSYGRYVNGTGDFKKMPPTFGAENIE